MRTPITASFLICWFGAFGFASPAARVEHVLEIGLEMPPRGELVLIGNLNQGLAAAHGVERTGIKSGCPVERRRGARSPRPYSIATPKMSSSRCPIGS